MAWLEENEVAGQEKYRMDRVGDYRKVDTEPKAPKEVDGREPSLEGVNEFRRPHGTDLETTYGERISASLPDGVQEA